MVLNSTEKVMLGQSVATSITSFHTMRHYEIMRHLRRAGWQRPITPAATPACCCTNSDPLALANPFSRHSASQGPCQRVPLLQPAILSPTLSVSPSVRRTTGVGKMRPLGESVPPRGFYKCHRSTMSSLRASSARLAPPPRPRPTSSDLRRLVLPCSRSSRSQSCGRTHEVLKAEA